MKENGLLLVKACSRDYLRHYNKYPLKVVTLSAGIFILHNLIFIKNSLTLGHPKCYT
jgi:hypothetical protein